MRHGTCPVCNSQRSFLCLDGANDCQCKFKQISLLKIFSRHFFHVDCS